MSNPQSLNIYSPADLAVLPAGERVFISHRRTDKPLAEAVAAVLDAQGVHYWFDRDDEDTQRAADLGMAGDQALVHSIERGIRHCSQMLGLLSAETRRSWWVPYEIGFSRSQPAHTSYLVLESIREMDELPAYARLVANYWSVDELVRWAASLAGGHVQAVAVPLDRALVAALEKFVPLQPPEPKILQLSAKALEAIGKLFDARTQEALRLTSIEKFQWLPTTGGLVRDLAYDLYASLAFYQLRSSALTGPGREKLAWIYRSVTFDYELAQMGPCLDYHPRDPGWRQRRYVKPASWWLQGLSLEQLSKRLRQFFIVPDMSQNLRLATREEFKAEFDRVLRSGTEHDQRRVGVLVNPLFGFTPRDRPVFQRVLALQYLLHTQLAGGSSGVFFEDSLIDQVERFVWNRQADGDLRPIPIRASHDGPVNAVAVTELAGRRVVVSGSGDKTARVWDLATGAPAGPSFTGHDGPVFAVAVTELAGRPVVVSGSGDKTVQVWDLATRSLVGPSFTGHDGPVFAVAVTELAGRPVVISGSGDKTVRMWDLATGAPAGNPFTRHGRGGA